MKVEDRWSLYLVLRIAIESCQGKEDNKKIIIECNNESFKEFCDIAKDVVNKTLLPNLSLSISAFGGHEGYTARVVPSVQTKSRIQIFAFRGEEEISWNLHSRNLSTVTVIVANKEQISSIFKNIPQSLECTLLKYESELDRSNAKKDLIRNKMNSSF